ncbi:LysR family transcriptional regulator [Pseudomonas sp. UBA2684]|uniref:LysR family transcriptional regulator n=1 Tax=Pseudomonas sp. UBA2684 TaxID=1947311 RepID=UPI000E80BDD3|nr:LysR family transcriptional regulator [Pseudomonas sp. UBA2684]HBX55840.1 LysR family transcriptional regulator [Pseudomonas sp.]|tara:strand:- start:3123 stop:4028 length:906 start_codon:yes stop_codon:yes gene_type:complete
MFELSQLRCFTTVATELNFRRAAERLNMTQPPLSRQIQLLEHSLGVSLFNRSTRSVTLTAAGRAFFIEAQAVLEHAQNAASAALRIAQGDLGSVTIGFVASAVYDFLPHVVAQARSERPGINIALHEMNTVDQLEALRARRIDVGIVRAPMHQHGFNSECLVREPFVLALPSHHMLGQQTTLDISALDGQPFIMYAHAAWQPFNELLTGMFRSARVTPDYVQFLGSTLTILALVNAGMGLALVPRSASMVQFEGVRYRPIGLPSGIQSELHLVCRDDNDNPAVLLLRDAIRHAAGNAQPMD